MKHIFFLFLLVPFFLLSQNEYDMGKQALEAGNYSFAKAQLESYLFTHPGDYATIEALGDVAAYQARYSDAANYYELLLDYDDSIANYHFKYGGALALYAQSISKARAAFYIGDIKYHLKKAAALDAQHIETRWALIDLYLALPGILGGSTRKAMNYANELLDISLVDGYLALGYVAEYDDRPNDAEKHFKKAVEIGGSMTCYDKLATLYENNNEPEQAMATWEQANEMLSRNALNYQIGKVSAMYGIQLDKGALCLLKFIENWTVLDGVPIGWAQYRLAQVYHHQGKKEQALLMINLALENTPDFKEAIDFKKEINR